MIKQMDKFVLTISLISIFSYGMFTSGFEQFKLFLFNDKYAFTYSFIVGFTTFLGAHIIYSVINKEIK